jgi:hypothetical protein
MRRVYEYALKAADGCRKSPAFGTPSLVHIRRERGQVQKGDASGDSKLRPTAIMLCRGYAVHEA